MGEIWLIRHAMTEWSELGKHTGRTDLPLSDKGREQAAELGRRLAGRTFGLVLSSPLQRAWETCRIAGYGDVAIAEPGLMEWDYGHAEGRTRAEIKAEEPGWDLWRDGVRGGESILQVAERLDAVIERVRAAGGDVALFAHGHSLRILAARWLGQPPTHARHLPLGTTAIGVLGENHDGRTLERWNVT